MRSRGLARNPVLALALIYFLGSARRRRFFALAHAAMLLLGGGGGGGGSFGYWVCRSTAAVRTARVGKSRSTATLMRWRAKTFNPPPPPSTRYFRECDSEEPFSAIVSRSDLGNGGFWLYCGVVCVVFGSAWYENIVRGRRKRCASKVGH